MALCLRKIEGKRNWENPRVDESWLGADDLRADALRDLVTQNNRLSVWRITDSISAQRIVAAIGATRDQINKLDFIIFDFEVIRELEIASAEALGETPDAAVNRVHLDLIQLTAKKLSDFGARIRKGQHGRYLDRALQALIQESVDRDFIDRARLKPNVASRIGRQS